MDAQEIQDRIESIAKHRDAGDYEAAGSVEARLHQDVLRAICDTPPTLVSKAEMKDWAKRALFTLEMDFPRHRA